MIVENHTSEPLEASGFSQGNIYQELEPKPEFDQLMQDTKAYLDESYDQAEQQRGALKRRLYETGAPAASVLIKQAREFQGETNRFRQQRRTLDLIAISAKSENVPELCDYWNNNDDEYMDDEITDSLTRLATPDILPFLEQQPDLLAAATDKVRRDRLFNLIRISAAGQYHCDTEEDRSRMEAIQERYVEEYNLRGDLKASDLKVISQNTDPSILAMQHAHTLAAQPEDSDFPKISPAATQQPERPEDARTAVIENLYSIGTTPLQESAQSGEQTQPYLESMYYDERNASPHAVTLGIEVEIYRPTIMPPKEVVKTWTPDEYSQFFTQAMASFVDSHAAGVPNGTDGLWEFAHAPASHYQTLSREVQALMRLNLINPDFTRHPLHLTIAGVTSEGPTGPEAYTLTRALEATGWSVTGKRLKKPALLNKPSWLYKGEAGVKEREFEEIQNPKPGFNTAIEIRTLQLQGLGGLDRTLRSAYALGSSLRAYQQIHEQDPDRTPDPEQVELAEVWQDFSRVASKAFNAHGMDSPSQTPWEAIYDYHSSKAIFGYNFDQLASLLDQAKDNPDSEGGKFREQMQTAVIQARSRAMAILDRSRTETR